MNNNAIAQLKQWKAQNTAQNAQKSQAKAQSKVITPPTAKNAQNAKQAQTQPVAKSQKFVIFPQTTRQFELSADSVILCKRNFPDCFHHKYQQAHECERIVKALAVGVMLADGLEVSNDERKEWRKVAGYLIRQFKHIHSTVKAVDEGEQCELKQMTAREPKGEQ